MAATDLVNTLAGEGKITSGVSHEGEECGVRWAVRCGAVRCGVQRTVVELAAVGACSRDAKGDRRGGKSSR